MHNKNMQNIMHFVIISAKRMLVEQKNKIGQKFFALHYSDDCLSGDIHANILEYVR